jgi:uncharacterized protein (TIGR02270 family)
MSARMMNVPTRIVPTVLTQHVEDAVQIRNVRTELVRAPHVGLSQLLHFDRRLLAHVSGILIAGADVERFLAQALESPDAGAGFVLGVNAIETGDSRALAQVLSVAEALPRVERGLLSAFGWVDARPLRGLVAQLLKSSSAFKRKIGIAACSMHDVDSGFISQRRPVDADPAVRARALRAAGELGAAELITLCVDAVNAPEPDCQFWGAWSAVLLGDRGRALDVLANAGSGTISASTAFQLALQAMTRGAAHRYLQDLAVDPTRIRWLIRGSGLVGDPSYVPWLIKHMEDVKLRRLAAESMTLITGLGFNQKPLAGDPPENFDSGPDDNPDNPSIALNPDDGLPWPEVPEVEAWWAANGSRFQKDTRYFMGAPVTREHCIDVLKNGYQRQRILAAHYLCLLEPGTPLFNTSAPAWRQQRLLAKIS